VNIFTDLVVGCINLNLTDSVLDLENTRASPSSCPLSLKHAMTPHNPLPNNDLRNGYGYKDGRSNNLDILAPQWASKAVQGWGRLREIKIDMRGVNKTPAPIVGSNHLTQDEVDYFTWGARAGFIGIALRHGLSPTQMWSVVESGMRKLGIHADDLDDLQSFCFGWTELTPESMCRWSLRYPKRCPLLDVLCSLDHSCKELNQVQDWLLDKKGSYGRTCNDVLPVLPTPDGLRPCSEVKALTLSTLDK